MKDELDLQKAERKAFTIRYQDGLWDVYFGSVLMVFAFAPFFSESLGDFWSSVVFLPFWLVVFALITWLRKRYVKPRMGSARYSRERNKKMLRVNLVLFAILLAGVLTTLFSTNLPKPPAFVLPFGLSLIFLVTLSVIAYFMDYRRLYIYAILTALAPLLGEVLWRLGLASHHGYPLTFGITSAICIISGLVQFIRFLRQHPMHPEAIQQ